MHAIRMGFFISVVIGLATTSPGYAQESPIEIKPEESLVRINMATLNPAPRRAWRRDVDGFRGVEDISVFSGQTGHAFLVYGVAREGVRAAKGVYPNEIPEIYKGWLLSKDAKFEWQEKGEAPWALATSVPYQLFSVIGGVPGRGLPLACASFFRAYGVTADFDATRRISGIYCEVGKTILEHQSVKDFVAGIAIRPH